MSTEEIDTNPDELPTEENDVKTYREMLIEAVDQVCAAVPICPFSSNTEDGIAKLKAVIGQTVDGDEWLAFVFRQTPAVAVQLNIPKIRPTEGTRRMTYPTGKHLLCEYGPTWNWYWLADLHADGTAEILCHDHLHRRDDSDRIEQLETISGRFEINETGERTAEALTVFMREPGVQERGWQFKISNPSHVFRYPRLSAAMAAA